MSGLREEYEALASTVGLFEASWCGVTILTGEDRLTWLQGLVTQDLRPLTPGKSTHAAMLSHKGKMVGDMRIHAFEDRVLLESLKACHTKLPEELDRYLFSEEVEIEDGADSLRVVGLRGPRSMGLVPGTQGADCGTTSVVGTPVAWATRDDLGVPGIDLFVPLDRHEAVWKALEAAAVAAGGRVVGLEAVGTRRVEAGTPWYGFDTDEDTIPVEAGLERTAISYDKGCYVGQEVIARLRSRGHVNRHLVRFRLEAPAPVISGTTLTLEGKPVGRITSCVRSPVDGTITALGYLRREHMAPGARFPLAGEAAGTAEVL